MKRFISFLCILVFTLFLSTNDILANEIRNDIENNIENNISNETEKVKPDKKTDASKSSIEDIFGDEQTFPFVAGLGKNAAH